MADPLDTASLLAASPLFTVISDEARADLAQRGRLQRFRAGEQLFGSGDPAPAIQVLLDGRVRLWRVTAQGQTLVLRICERGEVLGQMSALDDAPHSIHASAEVDCQVLSIAAQAYRDLLRSQPEAGMQLARLLATRIRQLSVELEAMKFASVGERVLRLLQQRAQGRREIRLTHQQLADQAGATRENVSRVLGYLRDQGAIALGRGRIEVLDSDQLESTHF